MSYYDIVNNSMLLVRQQLLYIGGAQFRKRGFGGIRRRRDFSAHTKKKKIKLSQRVAAAAAAVAGNDARVKRPLLRGGGSVGLRRLGRFGEGDKDTRTGRFSLSTCICIRVAFASCQKAAYNCS